MADRMLIIARIGAYCLNELVSHLDMGTMVHRFQGDDPDAWLESSVGCTALIYGRPVAVLYMDPKPLYPDDPLPKKVDVTINSIYDIVRPKNIGDFDPLQYGIMPNQAVNWMGDKEPDIESSISLEQPEEQIPGLFAKRNHLPQHSSGKIPKYYGSMDRRIVH